MVARRSLFWSGVFAVVLTAAVGYRMVAPQLSQAGLAPVPETLQIKPVNLSPNHQHVLRLRNTTGRPMYVEEFLSSCTCADVSPTKLTVPAHGEASVTLTLDLMRYLTPGSDRLIRGELHVAPVIAGKRQKSWAIAIEVIRPDVLVFPAGDIDFRTVYEHQSLVSSEHVLFIADEIPADSVSVRASSSAIEKVSLTPADGYDKRYRAYKLGLVLAGGARPFGVDRFAIAVNGASGKQAQFACQLEFDAGLRVHADKLPPTILRKGEEIQWSLDVYRLNNDLSAIEVELDDASPDATCSAACERGADGTWRVDCRLTPQAAGNFSCQCRITATLNSGERLTAEKVLRFYVPRSAKES